MSCFGIKVLEKNCRSMPAAELLHCCSLSFCVHSLTKRIAICCKFKFRKYVSRRILPLYVIREVIRGTEYNLMENFKKDYYRTLLRTAELEII